MILSKRLILIALLAWGSSGLVAARAQNAAPPAAPTAPANPAPGAGSTPALPAAPRAAPGPGAPTTPPGTKLPPAVLGIVDLQYVLQNCSAARNVLEQVDKQKRSWQIELEKRKSDLVAAQQDLDRQRATLAADAFNAKERVLLTQRDELQQDFNGRMRQLDDGFGQSMSPIQDDALRIIAAIMKERSLNLVLHKQTTIFALTDLDLTAEVMQRLDKIHPSATFKLGQPQKN